MAGIIQTAVGHHQAGRFSQAESLYRQVLQQEPNHPQALHFSGLLAHHMGNHSHALEFIGRAVSISPDYAEAHNDLGRVLQFRGEFEAAVSSFRNALRINPGTAETHYNLGNALRDLGEVDNAVASYRKAISIRPDYAEAQFNLGNILRDQGASGEAATHYRKAVQALPEFVEAHNNLGNALKDLGDIGGALRCYRKALSIRPDYAEAHFNLANVLRDQGDVDGAIASYRQALSIRPNFADAYSNVLFMRGYHGSLDPQEYLALARGWERACIPEQDRKGARTQVFRHPPLPGRRLRVGYVSGDFRTHAVSYFVEQLFTYHDRERIELFAFPTSMERDAVTSRLQALSEHWLPLTGATDATMRDRIDANGIDVLVDLSGHTRHNRLGVFARRAAPVQVHYLGYFASTGLTEMDYWVGDETLTPPETDGHFSEQVWRLPRVWVAYEGKTDAPAPERQADGSVRVGSFNNLGKLTSPTLALWARVLHAVPKAQLLLKTKALADAGARQRILDAMAAHGVSPDRVGLHDSSLTPDWASHMAWYNRLDIALDPVGGIGGGTTTCDALWMAVPVVTLIGDRMASRMTASMFKAIGHAEWIARSEDEYVQKVLELAADAEHRKELRIALRGEMAQSPLCDARGLASSLENAYFEMYDRWRRRCANP